MKKATSQIFSATYRGSYVPKKTNKIQLQLKQSKEEQAHATIFITTLVKVPEANHDRIMESQD